MGKADYKHRKAQRRRRKLAKLSQHLPTFILLFVITVAVGTGVSSLFYFVLKKQPEMGKHSIQAAATAGSAGSLSAPAEPASSEPQPDETDLLIQEANRLALGYDYDKAIQLLSASPSSSDQRIIQAVAGYEEAKAALKPADTTTIPHVFFHALIMDTSKAFDGDTDSAGYNSVMTTKDEFLKMLEAMYKRGYVLVRIRDIAYRSIRTFPIGAQEPLLHLQAMREYWDTGQPAPMHRRIQTMSRTESRRPR